MIGEGVPGDPPHHLIVAAANSSPEGTGPANKTALILDTALGDPFPFVIVELTQYVPAGKKTVPPPDVSAAALALLIAAVSSVLPFPTAP